MSGSYEGELNNLGDGQKDRYEFSRSGADGLIKWGRVGQVKGDSLLRGLGNINLCITARSLGSWLNG